MSRQFTPAEQAVLRIVQANLPDSLTPYADIAEQAGMTEAQVLELLSSLKESGAIRRFGASIKHQKTGWAHKTIDGGLSCQYEHQFVITKDGPRILTSQGEEGTY